MSDATASGVLDVLIGKPIPTREERGQTIGSVAGVSALGLDALASAAYGPEAALTVLLPLGLAGAHLIGPILGAIGLILACVAVSYRQTIAAYPGGGGSFTVARENLGHGLGVLAGSALALDYILNVAVGISAGVGALVSAVPALLPHTLLLCLASLAILVLVNLRGTKESGIAVSVPTLTFIAALGTVIAIGVVKSVAAGGAPEPVAAPPAPHPTTETLGLWIVMRAFASGCTAMTGIEAVANAVPVFREPRVDRARRTLMAIVAILLLLLAGIAYLCATYRITATTPGSPGYQSVLSSIASAVVGRGVFYFITIASILFVLQLSANTSFVGFPRLCRMLAARGYLPHMFAERGRRLVYTRGIVALAVFAGALLVAFGGITDRLIPMFAIGALLAFTLSQAGMVQHWRTHGGPHARRSMIINGVGASVTGVTVVVVLVSKFVEGAWLAVIVVPVLVALLAGIHRHYRHIESRLSTTEPLHVTRRGPPVAVVAASSWNHATRHALDLAMRIADEIVVVHIDTDEDPGRDLATTWNERIAEVARAGGVPTPRLARLPSPYRRFVDPFVDFIHDLEMAPPGRDVAVLVPDLITGTWYEPLLHEHRGAFLRRALRARCTDRVVVIDVPFHLGPERPRAPTHATSR